jgi:hypothetical protein
VRFRLDEAAETLIIMATEDASITKRFNNKAMGAPGRLAVSPEE